MKKLLAEDLYRVVRSLPEDIRASIKEHSLVLAGGYIRETVAGERPNDIDLLGPNEDKLKLASMSLYTQRGSQARTLTTKNAITHVQHPRTTVQFITRWTFDCPEECVESFDFTVCQAAVFWVPATPTRKGHWDSLVSDRFYADLASKRLVYTQPLRNEDAGGSMLRMRKFLGRGYHIRAEEMAKVMARMMQGVTDSSMATSEDGLSKVLASLLREVDPLHIVDGVEPVDIEHEEVSPVDGMPQID